MTFDKHLRLIIFTRYPEPGSTKTRMIPILGAEGAAGLQQQMTEHTLSNARKAQQMLSLDVEVRYQGGSEALMIAWLGSDLHIRTQAPGHIGQRMGMAFKSALNEKPTEQVVIIGSDIPGISPVILQQAFEALRSYDLVLGPAADGGYYLIGMKRQSIPEAYPALFENIAWGTAAVLSKTIEIAKACHLSYFLLTTLKDVDRPEDLTVWRENYFLQTGKKWRCRNTCFKRK
jgi:rSAM/selenodomain-associated transferase 1